MFTAFCTAGHSWFHVARHNPQLTVGRILCLVLSSQSLQAKAFPLLLGKEDKAPRGWRRKGVGCWFDGMNAKVVRSLTTVMTCGMSFMTPLPILRPSTRTSKTSVPRHTGPQKHHLPLYPFLNLKCTHEDMFFFDNLSWRANKNHFQFSARQGLKYCTDHVPMTGQRWHDFVMYQVTSTFLILLSQKNLFHSVVYQSKTKGKFLTINTHMYIQDPGLSGLLPYNYLTCWNVLPAFEETSEDFISRVFSPVPLSHPCPDPHTPTPTVYM